MVYLYPAGLPAEHPVENAACRPGHLRLDENPHSCPAGGDMFPGCKSMALAGYLFKVLFLRCGLMNSLIINVLIRIEGWALGLDGLDEWARFWNQDW